MNPPRTRRPARLASALVGVVAATALAGCSATNPITTIGDYEASDGLGVTLGDVRAVNLLVVTEEEGGLGTLAGALANGGTEDVTVTLQLAGAEPVDVEVPAERTVLMGATGAPERYLLAEVTTEAVEGRPGGTTTLSLATDAAGDVSVAIPVVDGTLPEYADLVPTAEPTPEPTEEPTAAPTEEPAPTAEPTS
ncbi:hypothetical protein [Cellulomonas oligotrophica]|uniref:Lipoprotein n=1 Tax=Cellulomonas oligotrophica TaxID=931536 RepID=A0A7Y9FGZ8_9CELL|nr:hypothetical protein [Cellulomonas oligotrophica]NYD87160.1 hypothetical protein [Cellulomonas oligotrophica]GIG32054.1 hypothetical protein Col01nite_12130 [Cellulomonas oligotrophica]